MGNKYILLDNNNKWLSTTCPSEQSAIKTAFEMIASDKNRVIRIAMLVSEVKAGEPVLLGL